MENTLALFASRECLYDSLLIDSLENDAFHDASSVRVVQANDFYYINIESIIYLQTTSAENALCIS